MGTTSSFAEEGREGRGERREERGERRANRDKLVMKVITYFSSDSSHCSTRHFLKENLPLGGGGSAMLFIRGATENK